MAAESLLYISYLCLVLLLGLSCTFIASKLRVPSSLLLIIAGIMLANLSYSGKPLIIFSDIFINAISIFAVALIIFDASSRFKLKELDTTSSSAFLLAGVFLLANTFAIFLVAHYILGVENYLLAALLGIMLSGVSSSAMFSVINSVNTTSAKKHRVFQLLEFESQLNSPLVIILSFLLVELLLLKSGQQLDIQITISFAKLILVSIGAGFIVGLVFLKFLRRQYSENTSPLVLLLSTLLAYAASEYLGGNGVLAVAASGFMFGNIFVKGKKKLQEFSGEVSTFLVILVFVLVGVVVNLQLQSRIFIEAAYLLGISILVRFLCVNILFSHKNGAGYSIREKIFISLAAPKGIEVAAVSLVLAVTPIVGMAQLLGLVLLYMIYSIMVSAVLALYSRKLTGVDLLQQKKGSHQDSHPGNKK